MIDLPSDIEAERALLGALMLEPDYCIDDVRAVLPTSGAFYDLRHQLIYRAVLDLDTRREPIDFVTVSGRLRTLPTDRPGVSIDAHEEAGGAGYISGLCMDTVTAGAAVHHAGIIAGLHLKRGMIRLAEDVHRQATDPATNPGDALEEARAELEYLADSIHRQHSTISLYDAAKPVLDRIKAKGAGEMDGVCTGYPSLDRVGGWQPSDLLILGARPSMGKTALALNVALNVARRGDPVGVLSVEMGEESLVIRALSTLTGFEGLAIRNKNLTGNQLAALYQTGDDLIDVPLHFDFAPAPTVEHARHTIRRMCTRLGCKLIVVDYLQLMTPPKADRADLAYGAISKGLKRLAKEFNVPIVALAQLNRGCDSRADKRPMLSDLRESGQIEQDADEVLFLYREHVYDKDADEGAAELIAAKRRNGPTGRVHLRFDKVSGRFTETAGGNNGDDRSF